MKPQQPPVPERVVTWAQSIGGGSDFDTPMDMFQKI